MCVCPPTHPLAPLSSPPPISKVSPSLSKRNHIETLEILLAAEV